VKLGIGPSTGILAVTAIAVLAIGVTASWLFLNPPVPSSLEKPEKLTTVPITYRDFTDDRVVPLTVTRDPDVRVQSPTGGRVTKIACTPGAKFVSGKQVLSVDGRPLIALATATPLWRSLSDGARGADVSALQRELKRLHGAVSVTGIIDSQTVAAVAKLFGVAGGTEPRSGLIPIDRILWIPQPISPVSSCGVGLGETVTVGEAIATLAGKVTRVAASSVPSDIAPGPRTLTVGSVTIDVDAKSTVTDAAALEKLRPSIDASSAGASDAGGSGAADQADPRIVNGQLSLKTAAEVAVVPPAAIYDIDGDAGCVWSSGKPYAVQIVGSELGRTYIQIAGDAMPKTVAIASRTRSSCR
jgi:hypothetical protein